MDPKIYNEQQARAVLEFFKPDETDVAYIQAGGPYGPALGAAGYTARRVGKLFKLTEPFFKAAEVSLPTIDKAQVGKKLANHAVDYGLPLSKAGAQQYTKITESILSGAQKSGNIRSGTWKTLPGQSEFWIHDGSVVITNGGKWITTFPLTDSGTINYINSLPIVK